MRRVAALRAGAHPLAPPPDRLTTPLLLSLVLLLLAGCTAYGHMRDQLRVDPLEKSEIFADNLSARPLPEHTVPRGPWGTLMLNDRVYRGQVEGEYISEIPLPVDGALVARGQEQYDVFCSPCHGYTGYGNGMIVQRGMVEPPSFHSQRLLDEPVGYYYDVISNGFGAMYAYDARILPDDRWAIVAYVRALQLSQRVDVDLLSAEERQGLDREE